jgi:transcriptional regulator with XRE-family HTH domain
VLNINSSLVNELRQKEYRDAYVASQIRIGLPFQIRALRNKRGWSQEEFAGCVGMSQPRVSEMERPGARRLNIETLLRVATAFDVGLQIRFVPFSELVAWAENFNPDDFAIPTFEEELTAQEMALSEPGETQPQIVPAAAASGQNTSQSQLAAGVSMIPRKPPEQGGSQGLSGIAGATRVTLSASQASLEGSDKTLGTILTHAA